MTQCRQNPRRQAGAGRTQKLSYNSGNEQKSPRGAPLGDFVGGRESGNWCGCWGLRFPKKALSVNLVSSALEMTGVSKTPSLFESNGLRKNRELSGIQRGLLLCCFSLQHERVLHIDRKTTDGCTGEGNRPKKGKKALPQGTAGHAFINARSRFAPG